MSKERTLANIAQTAWRDTQSDNRDPFDRVARAVEKEVLARLEKDEEEPVAGQELTFVQAAQWVAKYGSTDGLQWFDTAKKEWRKEGYSKGIYLRNGFKYRVAPKKVNDPDDPATWEKGVAILGRNREDYPWIFLDVFSHYKKGENLYVANLNTYKHAKLATPQQIDAWKLINDENPNHINPTPP